MMSSLTTNDMHHMIFKYSKFFLLFLFALFPHISHAETHVTSADIKQDWKWEKQGSPYILDESLYIPHGNTLTISEGVEIRSGHKEEESPNSITVEGGFVVAGTKSSPVIFSDLDSIYFIDSTSSIKYAVLKGMGLDFFRSTSTLDTIKITKAFSAISAKGSRLNITNSILKENSYAISSRYMGPIFPMFAPLEKIESQESESAHEGVAGTILDPEQNIIAIHNSSIVDNSNSGISNQAVNPIDATQNWWGGNDDPIEKVRGPVNVTPWLSEDPNKEACCSNVLFLPGIQASRLYKGSNMLWEPNRNDDVRKMFMDTQGKSIDPGILAKDIISSAFGVKDIYASFIDSMDGLVKEGLINEWMPVPYDWRKGAYDVADSAMLEKVYALASTSKNGKVSIIAHSNGGLVAKALMAGLEDAGRSGLVDKSIFVAVPELGTPQAILSMLHGDNQSIAGGLILSQNTSREFSKNLPGAYGLLPSKKFFEKNILSVISDFFSRKSGQSSSSYESMKGFLLNNSFSKASSTDVDIPLTLNSYLFSLTDSFHSRFDTWKPASTTKTISVFGWGMPTSKAINYEKDPHCVANTKTCDVSSYRTITSAGDGTVITATRSDLADETLFLDLKKIKEDTKKKVEHADILESPQLQNFLKDEITEAAAGDYKKYFSEKEPVADDKWLYVRVYSPVDIHVYDKEGNHTGSDEDAIPSSVYDGWGSTKQVILPYGNEYDIILDGTGEGTFSVATEVRQSDKVLASATFSELAVTASMNADLVIATSTSSFVSSTLMYIDKDGDGTSETIHNTDQKIKADGKDRKYSKKFRKAMKRMFHKLHKHR